MDYSKTINKPKTAFSMKANLRQLEKTMLEKWKKEDLYRKLLDKTKNNKKFILHDGPPYANGRIHIGHALNKILKDFVVKYKTLSGHHSPYVPGWDCHGLPIEFTLLKELGKTKHEIDILSFRKEAKNFALKYKDLQKDEFIMLGIFGDWENPYLTLSPEFERGIVSVFAELFMKGYIYKGKKPVYSCVSCETALAEAEVEYADHKADSIYVKFPVLMFPPGLVLPSGVEPGCSSVLIWTTTPWTLPANQAVAFNPELDYVFAESAGELFIFAAARLSALEETLRKKFTVLGKAKGSAFAGMRVQAPYLGTQSVGVTGDFVSLEDGTGIVHIAPGHGEDDYRTGIKNNLPVFSPVNIKGCFTGEVKCFENMHVFKANPEIIKDLSARGLLLKSAEISHSYPHCWRCKKPVIFRATEQWFLNIDNDNLRERLIEAAEKVNWIPDTGRKRIVSMLRNRPDWCLSRQRLWGTPVPVIYCGECSKPISDRAVFDRIIDVFSKEGSDSWFEKPAVYFLPEGFVCPSCGSKEKFCKDDNILDVWFDSGVSSFAVLKNREELSCPADLYLEGSDQARGWFQTSLIPAVALTGTAPYKNCLTHGFTVDGEGKKMSKSQGNVVAPQAVTEKYGAEILRLWVASCDYSEDVRISDGIITQLVDAYRKIRNTARFMLANIEDLTPEARMKPEELLEIDRWILAEFDRLVSEVSQAYEEYSFFHVYRKIYNFCTIQLSSLYFDISKDRLYTYAPESRQRLSCQSSLFIMLNKLSVLLAPVLSFTAEEIYQSIKGHPGDSVFLEDFPKSSAGAENEILLSKWGRLLKIKELANLAIEKIRQKGVIGNALEAKLIFFPASGEHAALLQEFKGSLAEFFIVSEVEIKTGTVPVSGDIVTISGLEGISALCEKTLNLKCERCWIHFDTVGKDEEHPALCSKCAKIVRESIVAGT